MAIDLNIHVVDAKVIPCERGEWGISYRTDDGYHGSERVGSRSQAEALVRRLKQRQDDVASPAADEINPFPKDVAAS